MEQNREIRAHKHSQLIFYKKLKAVQRVAFSKTVMNTLHVCIYTYMQKKKKKRN